MSQTTSAARAAQNQNSAVPNLAAVRILLWDIDGTLLRSMTQGSYPAYFSATMRKVFGSAGDLEKITASGMTDTQIICEALQSENFAPERVFAEKETLLSVFKTEMTNELADKTAPFAMLAGADEILRETRENPRFINALLTGNLSVAAEIKLQTVNLWHYFQSAPNAFGEISHQRSDLAIEAGRLFNERYDYQFNPTQFIVIGNTPNDIAAARAFGAKVLCVETGKNTDRRDLEANHPDALIEDLSDTRKILQLLENL